MKPKSTYEERMIFLFRVLLFILAPSPARALRFVFLVYKLYACTPLCSSLGHLACEVQRLAFNQTSVRPWRWPFGQRLAVQRLNLELRHVVRVHHQKLDPIARAIHGPHLQPRRPGLQLSEKRQTPGV